MPTRYKVLKAGSFTNGQTNSTTSYGGFNVVETLNDDKGQGDMRAFQVTRYTRNSGATNAKCTFNRPASSGGPYSMIWKDVSFSSNADTTPLIQHALSLPTNTELANYTTELMAKTNPSRPDIDLPVFLFELRELPELVRVAGNNLLKRGAGSYLSYEFGWKPLISDIGKLLDFNRAVDNRYKELKKLYNGGTKKTAQLGRVGSSTTGTSIAVNSQPGWITSTLQNPTTVTQSRVWGTAQWKPLTLPPSGGDEALYKMARRAVLGLYLNPAALWEALPWSWLADWFGTVGNYLNANRNFVPAKCVRTCIMQERISSMSGMVVHTYGNSWNSSLIIEKPADYAYNGVRTDKRRWPTAPVASINADLPFLSARQYGILFALSVVKDLYK